jgi:hypothetical protein
MSYRSAFRNQTGRMPRASDLREPALASAFSGVIDQVGVSAQVAFSTRKLRTAYAGSALRVRRSSDNAELDIGFLANGDLNTTALLAHTGAGNGFVVTWYDQSGNGNDVTQATALAQPQIVAGGSIHAINGKAAANWDGLSWSLNRTAMAINMSSFNAVASPSSFGAVLTIARQLATTGVVWYHRIDAAGTILFVKDVVGISSTALSTGAQVHTSLRTNGTNSAVYINGTINATAAVMSTTATTGNFALGAHPAGGQNFLGNIGEVIAFSADLSTGQRQTLERNQGTYFGVTVA